MSVLARYASTAGIFSLMRTTSCSGVGCFGVEMEDGLGAAEGGGTVAVVCDGEDDRDSDSGDDAAAVDPALARAIDDFS
jgi:hypothetical protein